MRVFGRSFLLCVFTAISTSTATTAAELSSPALDVLSYAAGDQTWAGDLTPISPKDWSYGRAAYLLDRAGFSGTPETIERLAEMTPEAAVAYLVDYDSIPNGHLAAYDESGVFDDAMLPDLNENFDFQGGIRRAYERGEVYGVKPNVGGVRPMQPVIDKLYYRNYSTRHEWERATVWWANRMLKTARPLEERMTLFWHDHFAVEQEKIRDYRLLLDQIAFLRDNATGNFRDLLLGISKDPGMLVYLDNRKNVKGHANENYGREVLELFGLGVGNYTEDDIKETARAFTGWTHYGRHFINRRELHDTGEKTILGETGNFDGEDVVDIVLRQEVCAEFISGKLYKYFVREDLSPELNARLAAILRDNDYELKPLLTAIFLSRDFYSPASFGTQIKSPVHFLVSTYARLGLEEVPGTPYFPQVSASLGQALGNPPNVAGWDGGRSWINPSTLVERGNIMRHVLFPREAAGQYDLGPFAGRYQRYVNAHKDVLERDRQALMGAPPASDGEMMEGAMASKMVAPSAKMINATPVYDLPYGVYNGKSKAYATVKAPDQTPAKFSLAANLQVAGVKTTSDAVVYLERLLLSLPLKENARNSAGQFLAKRIGGDTIDFADSKIETHLRELVHLIMSAPEYQLS